MRLDIKFVHSGDRTVLELDGSLDLQSRAELLAAADARRVELGPGGVLELDLSKVTFVDSSGLGALIELRHSYRDGGKTLTLTNQSPPVSRLLQLTALDKVFATDAPSD